MNKNSSSETLKSPKRCPEGTVLIRRTKKEDLIRAKRYGQQVQAIRPQDTNTEDHVRYIYIYIYIVVLSCEESIISIRFDL